MVTTSILLVINKVCGYLDNIRYVDIISVADTLFGHHQYISPITTIIYISHSFTQPRTFHNQHNNILHTTYHIQQSNYIHQQAIHSVTWSCRSHAGSCRSHAGFHADTCTLYPYFCCMWLCINHLIPDWSYFPSMTSLFDRLCRHMT